MSVSNNPFVVDGPVPPDSPVYIRRATDGELEDMCRTGQFVHVCAPPGFGKTSLMWHAQNWLHEQGHRTVTIDFLKSTQATSEDAWCDVFVEQLSDQLRLGFDGRSWWRERQDIRSTDRLLGFFEEIVLAASWQTVILIDEFEIMEAMGFKLSFLRFLRKLHEKRTRNSGLERISVTLLSFSRRILNDDDDTYLSNVIHTLRLDDFTIDEGSWLISFFGTGIVPTSVIHKVFQWTNGHPYLTQRACSLIYEARPNSVLAPDEFIRDYFLDDQDDPLLNYIRRGLTALDSSTATLKEYQKVLTWSPPFDLSAVSFMVEIGLLKPGTRFDVRNRIFREVFNEQWVKDKLNERVVDEDLTTKPGGYTIAGRYRLQMLIEHGAAGDLYRTSDTDSKNWADIRLIPARYLITDLHSETKAVKQFEDTLSTVASVKHPNILPVFDYGFSSRDGYFYVVMGYQPGGDLSSLFAINRITPQALSIDEVLRILKQIVDAVDSAHEADLLHGDLNPSKISIEQRPLGGGKTESIVAVADFGMARLMNKGPHGRSSQPPSEGEVGDPVYMAPEQIAGEGPWDRRADIYALGMIAYQMFGGEVPQFENLANILTIKLEKRFVSLRKLREGIPEAVERAIMRALEFDPNDRPASAREWFEEVSVAFQSAQTSTGTTAPHATGDFEVPVIFESQFTVDDPETRSIEAVISRTKEILFGGIKPAPYDKTDLRASVFVGVIRQSYTFDEFRSIYREAKSFALKTFIYIKREDTRRAQPDYPEVMSVSEFEDLKKEMLTDGAARFFDTPDELDKLFTTDLAEWLTDEFFPTALEEARQSTAEVITELLGSIKNPEALDQQLLDALRRRQVESTGQYWFYLSCAQDDWTDDDVQSFFQTLNAEVRALAGASEFYVGAFMPESSEVATTALRQEWFPHTVAALQNSRVLVSLCTRNYFQSEVCGKVWEFFQLRVIRENTPAPIMLPVLWSSNEQLPDPLPDTVASIQYLDDRFPQSYAAHGLRYLKRRNRDQYEEFIRSFARRLVEVATSFPVQPLSEPPAYSQLKNAFAVATAEETVEAETIPTGEESSAAPRTGRWIAVGGSDYWNLPDPKRNMCIELGREIARRGYGLVARGATGVEYFVKEGFAEASGNEELLKGSLKVVHVRDQQARFSSGSSILVDREGDVLTEQVKHSDVVLVSNGGGQSIELYGAAVSFERPIFPIPSEDPGGDILFNGIESRLTTTLRVPGEELLKLKSPVKTEADARRMSRTLLDMIDSLWLSPAPTKTKTQALSTIAFIHGNLLGQAADAIVNPVGLDPTKWGEIGNDIVERMGSRFIKELASQGPLTTGETLVTTSGPSLAARYVISVCSDSDDAVQTITSSADAVSGALKRAELLGLETVAIPSIGTGAARLDVQVLAPAILATVVDHLGRGSHLQTVLFVFKDPADYQAYFDTFIEMGGRPGYRVLLLYFSPETLRALRFAEKARELLGRNRISSSLLLWGLYQIEDGVTRELLKTSLTEADIDAAFRERLGTTDESLLVDIGLASLSTMGFASFTPHTDEAFVRVKGLAVDAQISERHLLSALLSVPEAHGTKWLSEIIGISVEDLYDIVAVHGDEQGKSITSEIANRRATGVSVETTAWILNLSPPQLNGENLYEIRVGERVTFTISLDPVLNPVETKNSLRIPANSLELTGWINAPGCQLPLEIPFTIKTIDGRPETDKFTFELKPLLSGSRNVEVELYPGGRVSNLGPAVVTRSFSVASPVVLPGIKELIDRRQIPNPQPDVMLYVALQETPTHLQTQIYLTCAALGLDREPLEPALSLNENDIAELRRFAVESAARASGLSPADALAVMRSVGGELFDRLINGKFEEYFHEINELAAVTNRSWSWLIISDENAVLPWELVCYYGSDEETIRYDDFLGDKFQIAHWVGQRGLRLMNGVPMGDIDFIHYNQRSQAITGWTNVLGPDLVKVESDAAQLSLLKENSYCFGLHLLRYAQEDETKQIIGVREEEDEDKRVDGEAITSDQKLDLTLRRPTVGLSFVSELSASALGTAGCDTHLESSWLLPFMQAGASALFGPRWPVSVEVDQLFVKEFYDAMRQGETLGAAFFKARTRLRTAFPQRTDWLAYTYFGHPHAEPYQVQPAQGFTLFEAVDSPKDELFVGGGTYLFRASYRTEAPAWYDGRLQIQHGSIAGQDLSVIVIPMTGEQPKYCTLKPVAEGNELQGMIALKMPELQKNTTASLPVMIRFQKATEELRTIVLNLHVKGGF